MKYKSEEQKKQFFAYINNWRKNNPEKVKEYNKTSRIRRKDKRHSYAVEYNKTHRDIINSQQRKWRAKNRSKVKLYSREWKKRNPVRYQFKRYKHSAKIRNHLFLLSFEEFSLKLLNAKCNYCGIGGKLGLDRVVNSIGYTNENTVPCCWNCNKTKRTLAKDTFVKICVAVANNQKSIGMESLDTPT